MWFGLHFLSVCWCPVSLHVRMNICVSSLERCLVKFAHFYYTMTLRESKFILFNILFSNHNLLKCFLLHTPSWIWGLYKNYCRVKIYFQVSLLFHLLLWFLCQHHTALITITCALSFGITKDESSRFVFHSFSSYSGWLKFQWDFSISLSISCKKKQLAFWYGLHLICRCVWGI